MQGVLYANVADRAVVDVIQGTYVWNVTKVECPDTLNRIYYGMMCLYVNSNISASLENLIAVLDQGPQVAGLEVMQIFPLCAHTTCMT